MDILLLVAPRDTSLGYEGAGDFVMDPRRPAAPRGRRTGTAPFVYAGVAIVKPETLRRHARRRLLGQRLLRPRHRGRPLFGLRLDGQWLHVGEPRAIAAAEERLAAAEELAAMTEELAAGPR